MKGGGGKGGDLMGFTSDKLYIVKEVNPGDQKSLLKITEDYAQHLRGSPRPFASEVLFTFLEERQRFPRDEQLDAAP